MGIICMSVLYQDKMVGMWMRVAVFLVILFFVLLSDAVLSDWVPGYLQEVLGSPLKMGLMMAASSIVGFVMDLLFPQILRQSGVRKLAGGAIVGALIFLLSMLSSTWYNYTLIILVGMAAWGIYYELDSFMTQQFVAGVAPRNERSSVWGVVGVVRNFAYFLGPIMGAYLANFGDRAVVLSAAGVLGFAYLLLLLMKLPRSEEVEINFHGINFYEELLHWLSLGKRVWPILLVSLMAGLIDATFWTSGTVLNDRLAEESVVGGWLMSAYMLPYLFVGIIVAKWGIDEGKKKWAERFLFLGGLGLLLIGRTQDVWSMLLATVVSSLFLAMAWPLVDAVYTDLVSRARRGRKHIIGMSSATMSLAYVLGPILSGYISGKYGELTTFTILGAMTSMLAVVLLITTPRKLRLPQEEIQSWK